MSFERRLIFLCGEAEGEAFRGHVARLDPNLETVWCSTVAALDFVTRSGGHRTRVISFLTDQIVPKTILERLRPRPINVHPGPPEFPGAHGLSFAIFNEAKEFGVTVHEMTAKVDDGPIIMVDRFALPSDAEIVSYGNEVYARSVALVDHVIHHCVKTDGPMPHAMREQWTDNHCTKRRLKNLMTAVDYLTPQDRARLIRACGPLLDLEKRATSSHG
ncbi:hypothetical protein HK107_13775 [Parvularcula sp. ZS-1/3]|uniref:Formyl transferase N-terminal domain-containing protein n=1 Tax=Parvularcula mediterranea TaxID=2732508 RepID=A0A7Y3RPL8_9PROT|nr:formyltransferase family protein [Parvularcula mediterranea]NNU17396.1 hypothetical protein [Parvularcula mediterranea]